MKDIEYGLTPKGEQLAKQMAEKNTDVVVETDKIKKRLNNLSDNDKQQDNEPGDEYVDEDSEVVPSKGMSYQQAKKLKKKSFGTLLAEQEGGFGESFKKVLSLKTQAKVKGLKERFDPMNIAKKMTFGSNFAPAMLGKMMGRSQEDISNFTGAKAKPMNGGTSNTATKIGALEHDTNMLDILMKIYTFMEKTHDENKKRKEEESNFAEENKLEKEKKRKEMLAILKGKKEDKDKKATEKLEDDTGMGVGGILGSILDAAGGLKSVLSIASMFMGPVGVALLSGVGIGLALVGLMSLAGEESHETANKVSGAMDAASEGQAIVDIEGIDKRKTTLLREANVSGKIKGMDFFGGQSKDYLKSIGWDEKTGTTALEREAGIKGVDTEGKPIMPKATETSSETTSKQKTESAAPSATPTEKSASAPTVTLTESSNVGQKLNSAVKENVAMNLPESTPDPSTIISKSSTSTVSNGQKKQSMLSVRNTEETFQRMIFNSTRVV